MTGGGDIIGDNGGGRGAIAGVISAGWIEGRGEGDTGVGERGGGRDGGAGLEETGGGTEGGLEERGGGGLETGGRGGGRDGGVDGGRGGQEDLAVGGGGLGRHGRAGGREAGREGGGMEAIEGTAGVSSGPVRGLVWPASWETTLASIIFPQIEGPTVLCHSVSL